MGTIAIPVVLQNLLVNSLTFVDTLMIGQLGSDAIAAVGLANQISFLTNLFYFGTCTGASIFIAQFYGAKNEEGIQKIMDSVSFGPQMYDVHSVNEHLSIASAERCDGFVKHLLSIIE